MLSIVTKLRALFGKAPAGPLPPLKSAIRPRVVPMYRSSDIPKALPINNISLEEPSAMSEEERWYRIEMARRYWTDPEKDEDRQYAMRRWWHHPPHESLGNWKLNLPRSLFFQARPDLWEDYCAAHDVRAWPEDGEVFGPPTPPHLRAPPTRIEALRAWAKKRFDGPPGLPEPPSRD
jgi:hypothetical protein